MNLKPFLVVLLCGACVLAHLLLPRALGGQVERIRAEELVQRPRLVHHTKPLYPSLAKEAYIQGTVRLVGIITTDGCVKDLRVLSGHPLLQEAALHAVKQWRYEPIEVNGRRVEVVTPIDVVFQLSGPEPQAQDEIPAFDGAESNLADLMALSPSGSSREAESVQEPKKFALRCADEMEKASSYFSEFSVRDRSTNELAAKDYVGLQWRITFVRL